MRERLIELLDEAFIESDDNYGMPNVNQCADYLLDNGVIVLPCKVGDTVYFLDFCVTAEDFGKKYIDFGKVSRLLINKYGKVCHLDTGRMFYWNDFNKNVFLTKEEAEAAVKGGAE